MSQVKATDKAGATITAFVHWVMADTACNLCFADIQGQGSLAVDLFINIVAGTECVREDGSYGWILFDPMTHTLAGYATR
jgi:hypothetical protein